MSGWGFYKTIHTSQVNDCSSFRGAVRFCRTDGFSKVVIPDLIRNLIEMLNQVQHDIYKFPSVEGDCEAGGGNESHSLIIGFLLLTSYLITCDYSRVVSIPYRYDTNSYVLFVKQFQDECFNSL